MPDGRKNILFVTNGLGFGGAEKLLVEIVNRLDLSKFNMTIASINSDMRLAQNILPGCAELFVYPRKYRYDLSPAVQIRKLIIDKKVNIIIPFAMYDFFFSRLATLMWKNYPQTNIYIHMTVPPTRKWFIQDWIYTRMLRDADRFISVCNSQAAYWSKRYDIPLDKFTTVYGGVDLHRFNYSLSELHRRDVRKEYDIPSDAYVVLQVASFREHKCHEDALKALKLVSGQLSRPVYLLLVGSGTEQRTSLLIHIAQDLGVTKRVLFCGEQQDVRPFICGANVFTLTSISETFSIAALEALAMGLPCVLTDIGGAKEMVHSGENGFLVKAGDSNSIAQGWIKVLDHQHTMKPDQIRAMVLEKFSISHMINEFERLLCKPYPIS